MQLKPEQLAGSLNNKLLPVYLISGDEPLQLGEAADQVRKAAREAGFQNRMRLNVETGFDWNQLRGAVQTQSLFAEKNLVELNLPSAKPGKDGAAAIVEVVSHCGEDNLLLIQTGKQPPHTRDSSWHKAVDAAGAVVTVWPLEGPQLSAWLQRRLRSRGLEVEPAGIDLLAQRVEGNLLAAAQEVDKLQVLFGSGKLSADTILEAVADSARFDVFKLVDSVLAGNLERSLHILQGLRAEKTAPPVILWALAREIRLLAQLSHSQQTSGNLDSVFRKQKPPVWDNRKARYQRALQRGRLTLWYELLKRCAWIDRCIKGVEIGDTWDNLARVCEAMCAPDRARIVN